MEDMIEDIIVDVIADGRVLGPQEIPPAVSAEIALRLARKETPQEIHHQGIVYLWSVRPCVYP